MSSTPTAEADEHQFWGSPDRPGDFLDTTEHGYDTLKRLRACPVFGCPHEFGRTESRADHIQTHDPADFGLDPLPDREGDR